MADLGASFAGVLLIVTGLFDLLQGLAAVADPDFYAAGSDYLYRINVSAWGWIHLVLGALSVVVGIAIVARAAWGQVIGMIVAGLAMLTNFAFLPYYPWWSMTIIVFNGFVIWALSVQLRHYRT
jgi:hypothetical protein